MANTTKKSTKQQNKTPVKSSKTPSNGSASKNKSHPAGYAGATFQNSPLPSSLPIPVFSSEKSNEGSLKSDDLARSHSHGHEARFHGAHYMSRDLGQHASLSRDIIGSRPSVSSPPTVAKTISNEEVFQMEDLNQDSPFPPPPSFVGRSFKTLESFPRPPMQSQTHMRNSDMSNGRDLSPSQNFVQNNLQYSPPGPVYPNFRADQRSSFQDQQMYQSGAGQTSHTNPALYPAPQQPNFSPSYPTTQYSQSNEQYFSHPPTVKSHSKKSLEDQGSYLKSVLGL